MIVLEIPRFSVMKLGFTMLVISFIGGAILEQIIEVRPFLILLLALVIADLLTGLSSARHRGEEIRSWGLRRTIVKFSLYAIAVVSAQGMQYVFGIPQVTYVVAFYICATEFLSNLENIGEVTGTNITGEIRKFLISKISGGTAPPIDTSDVPPINETKRPIDYEP